MNIRNILRAVAAGLTLTAAVQANAAVIMQVDSFGILTGAQGVDVGGKIYDVSFVDGECRDAYTGCLRAQFTFSTEKDARAAGQALLSQVFVDGPSGNFGSAPDKTNGCVNAITCRAVIPFERNEDYVSFNAVVAANSTNPRHRGISTSSYGFGTDFATRPNASFAYFTLAEPEVADVPEPSTVAMMAIALFGLALARRKA